MKTTNRPSKLLTVAEMRVAITRLERNEAVLMNNQQALMGEISALRALVTELKANLPGEVDTRLARLLTRAVS